MEAPFRFAFSTVGSKLYLLPPNSTTPKDFHLLASVTEGNVVTDSISADTIHLVLEGGDDWHCPLQRYFNKAIGTEWCFVAIELQDNTPSISVFSSQSKGIKRLADKSSVWLAPVTAPQCTDLTPKPKTIKKPAVKKSSDKSAAIMTTKVTKSSSGTKIVRKKIISKDSSTLTNGDVKEKQMNISKKISPDKITKPNDDSLKGEVNNGEGSGADSGVSVADSDNERSQKNESTSPAENSVLRSVYIEEALNPVSEKRNHSKVETDIENDVTKKNEESSGIKEKNNDFFTTLTLRLNEDKNYDLSKTESKFESKKMERIPEEDEKQKSEDTIRKEVYTKEDFGTIYGKLLKNDTRIDDESDSREQSSTSSRLTPPSELSDKDTTVQSKGNKERRSSPALVHVREVVLRSRYEIPVQVLQQVFKKFSYKELGELRLVHPHWDELCGQALNQAYYDIVKKANELLTDCQRRVAIERDLHDALSVLTNLQVHILNPVDILRPAMDEGVCCFPYGELLDRICVILEKVQRMMNGEFDLFVNWKSVAELARQAQMHYKTKMENIMEEKLGDVFRLKAIQQIQRIDSFMIDSTVSKLEKAAHMARDDLEWEIEQLRHQNNQLKKDNRELKKDYMRLESRVEILEGKLKTMARLLQ